MKRHEAIAPLSGDHHGTLILAQLMKKNAPMYNGLPGNTDGKALYTKEQFETHIRRHFQLEEAMPEKVKHIHPSIKILAEEIETEHRVLTGLFQSLAFTNEPVITLNELAVKPEEHIRKEEMVLFPLLQQQCSEPVLAEIHELLH